MASNPFSKAKFAQKVAANKPIPINPLNPSPESLAQYGMDPKKAREDLAYNALGFANTVSWGVPRAIANKIAGKEVVRKGGTLGRVAGLFPAGGFVRGAVQKALPQIAGRGVLKGAARGAIEGAALSQAVEPGPESALVGAATGGIMAPAAKGMGNLYNATFGRAKFLKGIIRDVNKANIQTGRKFGRELDSLSTQFPNRAGVDLESTLIDLTRKAQYDPNLASRLSASKKLQPYLSNPQSAKNLTAKQAQELINDFQSQVPGAKLRGVGIRPDELEMVRAVDDLKTSQAKAFPEMRRIRKEFARGKEAYRTIRPKITRNAVERQFLGKEGLPTLVRKDLEALIGPEKLKAIEGTRQANQIIQNLPQMLGIGGGTYAISEIVKALKKSPQ